MDSQSKSGSGNGFSILSVAIRISIVFMIICGILYPLASTGAAQLLFPHQANGSLLKDSSSEVTGSELIGQSFTDPGFFQGRVSSIDHNAAGSGSNNFAPSNPALIERTKASIEEWKANNPEVPVDQVPIALITNSGSGLDPHITPKSASVQIPRISKVTGLSQAELETLVKEHIEGRDLGLFGEERVNVLKLNLALSAKLGK
ncbi:potassium-transporting ATPase subunit KdpC [Paenibacillus alkaliterrae]|uniref:potassium-transporting ATPase subunit KdpC n=1 Tax=Paenibacillus alkaliterrae TaxID=320909 RepID=UPI001F4027F0|nr:potassium-transporting ATPase subunit KdpC [Paenibacillus alkaliterrae]MCF2939650.1 potassium-transporting ATPase subunit KdpC [Paenibacillus alkaliterrae]